MKFIPAFIKLGGRRAAFISNWHRVLAKVSVYSKWQNIQWASVNRLIFVCKGNICRSAYAHAYTQARHAICVTSAGLDANKGVCANSSASICAATRGIDMGEHRAQPLSDLKFGSGDLVIVFEPSQLIALERLCPDIKVAQRTLMGLHSTPVQPYIHDPYGLSLDYFETCFNITEMNIDAIIKAIRTAS